METENGHSNQTSGYSNSEVRNALQYGIDIRKVDESRLTGGEQDIYDVFKADIRGNRTEKPEPLIIGLMHMIQQKYGDESVVQKSEFSY
jgi:hypothetical protein